jgi:serine/threonine-protein kinase
MATVWAGIDARLDRPVAVKLLDVAATPDPSLVQFLDREARLVARLAHPNIVTVHDVGSDGGVPYIVMELVEGEDLRRRLESGPLAVPQVITITEQICAALAAAHAAGVVHGDIKPDNVMLTRAGLVKVCDFGIARLNVAGSQRASRSSVAVGTSEYMAPEQATGGAVDPRTDLYALGCVIYAMLSGRPPFSGDPARVLWQQVHQNPEPIGYRPDVPSDLRDLLTKLLAKNPSDRPASAAEVISRLAPLRGLSGAAATVLQPSVEEDSPISARARVVTPTRTMPAVDVEKDNRPARTGLRVGPIGIASVAVGAAVVTAFIIAILSAIHPAQPAGAPASGQSTVSGAATTSPPITPTTDATSADGVRAAIDAQVQAGQLTADDASQLIDPLNEVDRDLARGRTSDAVDRLNEVRSRLSQYLNDTKITQAGYDAILSAIDQLTASISQTSNGN